MTAARVLIAPPTLPHVDDYETGTVIVDEYGDLHHLDGPRDVWDLTGPRRVGRRWRRLNVAETTNAIDLARQRGASASVVIDARVALANTRPTAPTRLISTAAAPAVRPWWRRLLG